MCKLVLYIQNQLCIYVHNCVCYYVHNCMCSYVLVITCVITNIITGCFPQYMYSDHNHNYTVVTNLIIVNVDHLVTTYQEIVLAYSLCLQQSLIEKMDWQMCRALTAAQKVPYSGFCLRSLISAKHQFLCPAVISAIIISVK